MQDAFGTEIEAGDVVVHASRQGSSLFVKKVKILAVEENSVSGYHLTPTQRRTTLITPSSLCVLKTPEEKGEDNASV